MRSARCWTEGLHDEPRESLLPCAASRMEPATTWSAGATMTSEEHTVRAAKLDNATRNGKRTEDEQLFRSPQAERPEEQLFTHTDPWRVLRIMGKFVEGFDRLA